MLCIQNGSRGKLVSEKLVNGHAKHIGDLGQKAEIGEISAALPFGDRLCGDAELCGDVRLGEFGKRPQAFETFTEVNIQIRTPFLKKLSQRPCFWAGSL